MNLRDESLRTWTATTAVAVSRIAAATTSTTRRVSFVPATSASPATTAKIVTMLDCEYENQSAANEIASSGAATVSRTRPYK